jgi:hypothetical protein
MIVNQQTKTDHGNTSAGLAATMIYASVKF